MEVEGPSAEIVAVVSSRATEQLTGRLEAVDLVVSTAKTKVLCSSAETADATQAAMRARNLPYATAGSGRDLGVDVAAGRRRVARIALSRVRALGRRVARIGRMARVRKAARQLYKPASAQGLWGQEIMGISSTTLKELRRQALRAAGFRGRGLCTSSAIVALLGPRGDPGMVALHRQVTLWLEAWLSSAELRSAMATAWPELLRQMDEGKWVKVKGPGAALILVLRHVGWEAVGPNRWVDPRGDTWCAEGEAMNNDLLLEALAADFEGGLLDRMSRHWMGEGMQGGIDHVPAQALLKQLKHSDRRRHALMVRILAGGLWCGQRRQEQLAAKPPGICTRCDEGVLETDFHRCWECKANNELKERGPEAFSVEVMLHAFRYASQFPAFVVRGVLPAELTDTPSPSDTPRAQLHPPLREGQRLAWKGVRAAFTDGSGGEHSADRRLRRCGWGFAVARPPDGWQSDEEQEERQEVDWPQEEAEAEDFVAALTGSGVLPGPIQRVGRAELYAAIALFKATSGRMVLWSDYKAFVDGFARGRVFTRTSRMADLWEDLWDALEARPGGKEAIEVKKVKAHISEEDARSGKAGIAMEVWLGNRAADQAARRGADAHELPADVVQRVKRHSDMTPLFLRRIACVIEAVMEKERDQASPLGPRRATAPRPRWTVRRRALRQALADSGHRLSVRRLANGQTRVLCTKCLAIRRSRPGLTGWLRAARCPGVVDRLRRPMALSPQAHYSHELELRGEVVICARCGYYTGVGTCIRDLKWPCGRRQAPRAAENFRRTSLGQHPRTGKRMEDIAEEVLVALECTAQGCR